MKTTSGMLFALAAVALLALGVRDPGPVKGEEPDKLTVDMDESRGGRYEKDRGRGDRGRDRGGRGRRSMEGSTRYRVEVGHKDRVKPGAIVGAITHEGGLNGSDLGQIDIYPSFSLVEIGVPLSREARERISEARVSGRQLRISEDRGPRHDDHDRKYDDRRHDDRRHDDRRGFRSSGSDQSGRGKSYVGDRDRRYRDDRRNDRFGRR